ncbi:alpha-1,2-mannosyltransferase [Colletotrichum truncatum]|uniref:Alpha-1,2-mannosyltransferase n=1 Tax=Colletotrichum truncatum TaxID=5467 RepID=A0ACC3Z3K2_COLTU|nr:alpha-1,2-mannosyltransferase [Colletotrichum truncatum]KAF6795515.1 alpha-1,2-mannosyltransferase [Colletotrichum truncatum]
MLFPKSRRRPAWPLFLIIIPFFLTLLYIRPSLTISSLSHAKNKSPSRNATSHLASKEMQAYWAELHSMLSRTNPSIEPLTSSRDPTPEELDAAKNTNSSPRPDLITISDSDLSSLKSKHSTFVASLKTLGPKLPTWKGTTGVVMTAGGGYLGTAVTSILMLRRSGSTLPVHLFLDTPDEYDRQLCEVTLPQLNTECLIFTSVLRPSDDVKHYQYKVLSILLSPFEKVLLLDSDAWPVTSPDRLFTSEPFTSNGLITWPDFWLTTISPHFYAIANFTAPPILRRRSSESGILLYDKKTHAESLLLATYYNWYGPGCFYPLLSQHAPGEGDKETFAQAALALSQPFYDVRTPDTVLGRWINGSFETAGMKQADPAEDYRLQSPNLSGDHAQEPAEEKKAKPLFIHHNLFKLDIFKVGASSDPMFRLNEEGRLSRLWGPDKKLVENSGFDVERAMWDVVLAADCGSTFYEECENLKRWYQAVFVDSPPLVDGL